MQLMETREAHNREIKQIRITQYCPRHSIVVVPYIPEEVSIINWALDCMETNEREILIHPEDWMMILKSASVPADARINGLWGIPVING